MPILNTGNHLLITHRLVGKNPVINPLGDISVETTIMLEAHYLDKTAAYLETNKPHNTGIEAAKRDRTNLNWLIRAYKAAEHHDPPLATSFGELTTHGESLTDVAAQTMSILYDHDPNYAHPELLGSPDDWFIQLRMPIRSVRMLQSMHQAIKDSELFYNINGPRTETWEEIVKEFKANQTKQKPLRTIYAEDPNELFHLEPTFNLQIDNQKSQNFETITIQAKDFADPEVPTKRTTIIPTSIFGQKARTDLKQLMRYGLVNVRVIRHGGRGRPKQAVLISPIGQKLVEHEVIQAIR